MCFVALKQTAEREEDPPPPLHKHTHTHTHIRARFLHWQSRIPKVFLTARAATVFPRQDCGPCWAPGEVTRTETVKEDTLVLFQVFTLPDSLHPTPLHRHPRRVLFHVFTLPHSYSLPCLYSTSLLFSYMSSHYLVVSTATPATFSSMSLHYLTLILLHVFTLPHSYSLPCLYTTSLVVSSATPATSHPTVPHPPSRTSPRNLHPATKAEKWLWPWPNKLWARHLRGVGGPIYMNDYSLIWVWVCSGPEWEDRFCFRSMKCFPGGNIPVPLP